MDWVYRAKWPRYVQLVRVRVHEKLYSRAIPCAQILEGIQRNKCPFDLVEYRHSSTENEHDRVKDKSYGLAGVVVGCRRNKTRVNKQIQPSNVLFECIHHDIHTAVMPTNFYKVNTARIILRNAGGVSTERMFVFRHFSFTQVPTASRRQVKREIKCTVATSEVFSTSTQGYTRYQLPSLYTVHLSRNVWDASCSNDRSKLPLFAAEVW